MYEFSSEENSIIERLKEIVIIKNGNFKAFKLKKERVGYRKSVVLYAPKLYDTKTVDAYLLKNENSIYKLSYRCNLHKINLLENKDNSIIYLGSVYDVVYNGNQEQQYNIDDTKYIIYSKHNLNIEYRKLNFYREQAEKILYQRLMLYAENFGLTVKALKIKNYKSLWGACYIDNTILLNERLILAPLGTIDAIICHELAHIIHPNHSKEFYSTLEKLYPNYYKDYVWLNLYMPLNL